MTSAGKKVKVSGSKEHVGVIVVDYSTDFIKAGWSGEETPRCCIPAVLVSDKSNRNPFNSSAAKDNHADVKSRPTTSAGQVAGEENNGTVLVGQDALDRLKNMHKAGESTEGLQITYPIKEGRIVEWEAMIVLFRHIFVNELKVGTHPNYAVLVMDSPMSSEEYRIKLCRTLFTEFRMPSLSLGNRGTMALFDSGISTGIVLLTSGDVCYAVPVYRGFALTHAIINTKLGGKTVTEVMKAGLKSDVKESTDVSWAPIMEDIREKSCFVIRHGRKETLLRNHVPTKSDSKQRQEELLTCLDPSKLKEKIDSVVAKDEKPADIARKQKQHLERLGKRMLSNQKQAKDYPSLLAEEKKHLKLDESMLYELPKGDDGEIIQIHDQLRFVSPEALFAPSHILGRQCKELGVQDLLFKSINMCDGYISKILIENVVIAGEETEIPGFAQRVQDELYDLYKEFSKHHVSAHKELFHNTETFHTLADVKLVPALRRKDASWRGGSMFATLKTFPKIRFTREKFQEDEKIALKRYF